MGIRRAITRLAGWAALLFFLTLLSVALWSRFWPSDTSRQLPKADAIVCLGAGVTEAGAIGVFSRQRAQSCIDLYQIGVAPKIAFTGGLEDRSKAFSVATLMAEEARKQGVPASAILTEHASLSTLQNALYTLPMLGPANRLILVTDSYHLPRSYLSFKWAGLYFRRAELYLYAAQAKEGQSFYAPKPRHLLREAAAFWFNLGRATLWSAARVFGAEQDRWLN